MRQLRERIDLIHELRQLAATEEVAHHGGQRLRVDQLGRRHGVQLLIKQSHALLDQALGTGQADTTLVGQKFAHRTHTAATQVIDIVNRSITQLETEQVLGRLDQVLLHQRAGTIVALQAKFLVDLVAPHATQVVALGIEEQTLHERAGVGRGRRIAGAQALVNLLQGFLLIVSRILGHTADNQALVAGHIDDLDFLHAQFADALDDCLGKRLERACDNDALGRLDQVADQHLVLEVIHLLRLLGGDLFNLVKCVQQRGVAAGVLPLEEVDRTQEGGDQKFATTLLPVKVDVQHVAGVELRLEP